MNLHWDGALVTVTIFSVIPKYKVTIFAICRSSCLEVAGDPSSSFVVLRMTAGEGFLNSRLILYILENRGQRTVSGYRQEWRCPFLAGYVLIFKPDDNFADINRTFEKQPTLPDTVSGHGSDYLFVRLRYVRIFDMADMGS
jgi:hypothetical protein